jgi:phage FluMu gp28-like protein
VPTPSDILSRHLLPYQKAWVTGTEGVALAVKSRRIGWTYASACRAVYRRLLRGRHLYYTSADLSTSREFVEECLRWAGVFDAAAEDLGEQVISDDGKTAFVLRFANGAKIVAGSSSPKFFRGKGGDVDLDEFAFHPDQRSLWKAAQPAAVVAGHHLRVWSSPNGAGCFFDLLASGRAMPGLSVRRVTLVDAVAQGLVERLRGLGHHDAVAREAFLRDVRASCPDEASWREEFLCEPSSEEAALLPYDLVRTCEADAGQDLEALPDGRGPYYAGLDVGRKHHRSVLWVVEKVGDVFHTRALKVMAGQTFTAQEGVVAALLGRRSVRRLCVDSTGIGAQLAERMGERFGHRCEAVTFTAPTKAALALPLRRLFEDRLVRVPAADDVREDLHGVRRVVTSAGNVRLDAADNAGGHSDRFWALALAVHAADADGGRLVTVARKPAGW